MQYSLGYLSVWRYKLDCSFPVAVVAFLNGAEHDTCHVLGVHAACYEATKVLVYELHDCGSWDACSLS